MEFFGTLSVNARKMSEEMTEMAWKTSEEITEKTMKLSEEMEKDMENGLDMKSIRKMSIKAMKTGEEMTELASKTSEEITEKTMKMSEEMEKALEKDFEKAIAALKSSPVIQKLPKFMSEKGAHGTAVVLKEVMSLP